MADGSDRWGSTTAGILICVIGFLLAIWGAWVAISPGIVMKPDVVYDFIIVGGGTAGCVLASRLAEISNYKVLLIEAGGEEPWLSSIPLAAPLLQKSKHDWQYKTLPQKNTGKALYNQESSWPRGKLLGGTGQINLNIHTFGSPQDFDLWETEYGAQGWGFDQMQKYANKAQCLRLRPRLFKDSENVCSSAVGESECSDNSVRREHRRTKQDAVQCYDPPLRKIATNSQLSTAFLEAGKEIGLPVGNLNEDIDYGVMAAESSIYKGQRWGTLRGYLRPALGNQNLHVVTNTQVKKIIWDGKRAVGVQYFQWDNPRMNGSVYARGEVILSAGSINTPVLLIHSGIGPKKTIQKLRIEEISVLEGVGLNLQDHLNLPLYISLQAPVSLNARKLRSLSNIWSYFTKGEGDLGRSAIEGVATAPVNGESPEVGLIMFGMGSVDKDLYSSISNIKPEFFKTMFPGMQNESSEGFIFLATCLHPRSRGQIIVDNLSPLTPPMIQPNYLQHSYDLPCMRDAFRFAVRMSRTQAFESLGASLQLPQHSNCIPTDIDDPEQSRLRYQEYISCIVTTSSITGYHPLGTARMGRVEDPMAVVNPSLQVKGVERLRIVDASVMPTQISGAPNSAIIVIAEKAADILKAEWGDGKKLIEEKICSTSSDCEEKIFNSLKSHAVNPSSIFPIYIILSSIFIKYLV